MTKLDDTHPVEVAPGIWWVGFADYEAGFSNNPYLLVDGEEAILFDPGPGHPLFRDLILQKVGEVLPPERIRYIVVHHQDPDLCGLIPYIENLLHPDLVLMAHPRTCLFIPYYGARRGILPVGDGDELELKSGRRIAFYHAPYLHFAGNMMTYDPATASLFSGDIYAVFDRDWQLYADESYIELSKQFIEHYIGSREPLLYAYEKIRRLKIDRILPQHGGIIAEHVDRFLQVLTEVEPGRLLEELTHKPNAEQEAELLETGRSWMRFWLHKPVEAASLSALMQRAIDEGPTTVSLLIDAISEKARALGVANPLTYSQVHRWDRIWATHTSQALDALRRRFLSRQYGIRYGAQQGASASMEQGLQAFKTTVAVMFVDIRGFTAWSADRTPVEVVSRLDRQHEMLARIIAAKGGRLNKVLGDGLLAYFPEGKADACAEAAIEMQAAARQHDMLPIGIGCDYGEVIMGDIGQEARLDYTLIGATVNTASRMCSSAGPGAIAFSARLHAGLSDETREAAGEAFAAESIAVRVKPTDPVVEAVLLSPRLAPTSPAA